MSIRLFVTTKFKSKKKEGDYTFCVNPIPLLIWPVGAVIGIRIYLYWFGDIMQVIKRDNYSGDRTKCHQAKPINGKVFIFTHNWVDERVT